MNPKPDNASPDRPSLGNLEPTTARGYPKGKLKEPQISYGPLGGFPWTAALPWHYLLRIVLFAVAAAVAYYFVEQFVVAQSWYRDWTAEPGGQKVRMDLGVSGVSATALATGWLILCILLPPSPYPLMHRILAYFALNLAIWITFGAWALASLFIMVKFGATGGVVSWICAGRIYQYLSHRIQTAFAYTTRRNVIED